MFKISRQNFFKFSLLLTSGLVFLSQKTIKNALAATIDPLPSWNEGKTKSALLNFVSQVTTPNSPYFVEEEERIAVFDNDGTLWSEYPVYFQFLFVMDRIKTLAPAHPEWQNEQPFQAVLENDLENLAKMDKKALLQLLATTHAGMTTTEFTQIVQEWIATAKHPITQRLYTDMVFQPMLELLNYLRQNGFKTYIVSGGGQEFIRAWAEEIYGIPPEQVIGSTNKTRFELLNGQPVLVKLPEIDFINDGKGKPININKFIGRRPIAAFGNSDGDLQMLQWTAAGEGKRFMLIIHHTDEQRESAYDRNSPVGRLDAALDQAKTQEDWVILDMKKDWNTIYPR